MPASLAWSSPPKSGVFQVFSQKRKATDGQGANMDSVEMSQDQAVKRRCVWQGQGDGFPSQEVQMESNHTADSFGAAAMVQPMQEHPMMQESPTKTWCSRVQQQQVQRSPSPWPMDHFSNNNTHAAAASQQNDMIMNINDETYSVSAQEAAMDSDCAPDPSQYSTPTQQPGACRQLCGGAGPTLAAGGSVPAGELSDQVRCFCRPTWDSQLSMKPYVSDIY